MGSLGWMSQPHFSFHKTKKKDSSLTSGFQLPNTPVHKMSTFLENVAFVSELCNPVSLSSVCQECSREVTARRTGLNQIHKASIVPPGCDPNDWRLHWPRSCRTDRVCLEARVLQVVIPIIINYHISAAHRCTQLLRKTGKSVDCQDASIMLSHNKHQVSAEAS